MKKSKVSAKVMRKRIEKKLDTQMRLFVLARDKRCVTCGIGEGEVNQNGNKAIMQCGHLITRAVKSVKYDLRNIFLQCSGCNLRHEFHPEILTKVFLDRYGKDEFEDLVLKSNQTRHYTHDELKTMLEIFNYLQNNNVIINKE